MDVFFDVFCNALREMFLDVLREVVEPGSQGSVILGRQVEASGLTVPTE